MRISEPVRNCIDVKDNVDARRWKDAGYKNQTLPGQRLIHSFQPFAYGSPLRSAGPVAPLDRNSAGPRPRPANASGEVRRSAAVAIQKQAGKGPENGAPSD